MFSIIKTLALSSVAAGILAASALTVAPASADASACPEGWTENHYAYIAKLYSPADEETLLAMFALGQAEDANGDGNLCAKAIEGDGNTGIITGVNIKDNRTADTSIKFVPVKNG